MTDTPPPAQARLADDCAAHLAALGRLEPGTFPERDRVQQEIGWVECLEHLARRGGLSAAGQVEARRLVDGSRHWAAEFAGEEPEGHGRGR